MADSKDISRRKALKIFGLGAAALAASAMDFKNNPFMDNLQAKALDGQITPVDRRKNIKNGDLVSMIGFGCMRFPTNVPGRNAPVDEAKVQELVDYAYAHGINYYDTAYVYHGGKSEGIIGRALKKYPRNSYFLADKMPGYRVREKEDVAKFFEEQLQRCGVDYFDYYLLHSISDIKSYDKVYEEMGGYAYLAEQKKKGRIKNLGFSFHSDRKCWEHIIDLHPWDFVQIQLNYIDWKEDGEYLYNSLAERKIPAVIMEPLLGGRLATLSESANKILMAKNPDSTIASWAFRYLGSLPGVLVSLSGMTYMEHLVDNVKTFTNFKPLTLEEQTTLQKAILEYQSYKRINCTACRYCMPCPFEVEIPSVFATYNKFVMNGTVPNKDSQSPEDYARNKAAFADAFRKEFASGGGPEQCASCQECLSKCPQHLPIPELMEKISSEF
ncbi:MAG: aldo/keto reductase [Bacteroidales bacterium]|nr:aldo/keto reductase [Bacteroidales bacterium]